MARHFDLIVIGSGPAGRRAAVQAAKLKKSVLVVERGRCVGGVCVHTGTIPSKTSNVVRVRAAGNNGKRPETLPDDVTGTVRVSEGNH